MKKTARMAPQQEPDVFSRRGENARKTGVSIRLTDEQYRNLALYAAAHDRTISWIVSRLVDRYFKEWSRSNEDT
jgi:hypothetical protein